MQVTLRLVEHARTIGTLSADVEIAAKTCVLDWLGCALAGSREPLTEILAAEVDPGDATLIGRDATASMSSAALVNGAASHALDYDDTHLVMSGHPSVPVVPALLALAERERSSGAAFLRAFVAGVETECRVGALLNPSHYARGFHATATVGTFGAAAACCHLLGVSQDRWSHAFGIAGTQAAGLKSVFGTMSKPLHAGTASRNGLLAATLAARGFTSDVDILDSAQGFADTHADGTDGSAIDRYEDRWLVRETVFKYHAACYLTHSAIEATLRLGASSADAIEVAVPRGHLAVCNIAEPTTGLEGKFSLRATVAMAMLGDDTADPAAYTDERMASPELVALRDKVTIVTDDSLIPTGARVTIDGRSETVDVGRPASDLEEQWDKLAAKFTRLATPVVGEDSARKLVDVVRSIDGADDVTELLALV